MHKTSFLTLILGLFFAFPVTHAASPCSYEIDSNTTQVQWTAYKTHQKVGVNGHFAEVTIAGELHDADLGRLLGQLEAEIALGDAKQIVTGNPARDQTLYDKFFSLVRRKTILGAIHNVRIDSPKTGAAAGTTGTFDLKLSLNGKNRVVPFKFTLSPEGAFVATGAINVLDFALNGALDSLHKACEALHTGTDQKSKTWPDVDLKLAATIRRSCN